MGFPRAVVTDANIWIDLHRGGVVAEAFKLDLMFKTPDLVAHEILWPSVASLKRYGLQVVELPGVRLLEIIEMARKYPRPSRPDLAALVLARFEGVPLLTGDKALRAAAEEEGIEVRGVLGLLDDMVNCHVLTGPRAAVALQQMRETGSRLPEPDCKRHVRKWTGKR